MDIRMDTISLKDQQRGELKAPSLWVVTLK